VTWLAPDWRELVRAPLRDLVRELLAGRVVVLVSDPRAPELSERLALAASAAGLPAGVLGLLHGQRHELLARALARADARSGCRLVASGLVERMAELRRLEAQGSLEARLRGLRCGTAEVDPLRPLEHSAAEAVERAFGRGTTFGGQLPGTLGRVFCPARLFSRFTELCLALLEDSAAARSPVLQIDEEGARRVRAAWELGLDEGATCIAGGDAPLDSRALPPTIFTNVEPYMACVRRQDPLPVLCLLRAG
jgi:acyl-CoA reductase-like NAD-dependent aldehyde dehydrogenase